MADTESIKPIIGNTRDQELLERAEYFVYPSQESSASGAYCFQPPEEKQSGAPMPVVLFFHGGSFDQRLGVQFAPHCLHFANRGVVAFSVEYRVSTLHGTGPMEAMEDARAFLEFLRENQTRFNIDIDQLVIGGSASGGLLALHLASRHKNVLPLVEHLPKPKGLILYAPLSNTTPKGKAAELFSDLKLAKQMSPSEQTMKDLPALIVFHGKADQMIPFAHSEKLVKGWKKKKNQAELIDFETGRHIDFNLNVNPEFYEITLKCADHFMTELGMTSPDPDAFID